MHQKETRGQVDLVVFVKTVDSELTSNYSYVLWEKGFNINTEGHEFILT